MKLFTKALFLTVKERTLVPSINTFISSEYFGISHDTQY